MQPEKATLLRLKRLPQLFRKADAEKIAPHPAIFLSRAVAKGLIHRPNRGNYVNAFLLGLDSDLLATMAEKYPPAVQKQLKRLLNETASVPKATF